MSFSHVLRLLRSTYIGSIVPCSRLHNTSFQANRSFLLKEEGPGPDSSLWFTTLPKKSVGPLISRRKKKVKTLPRLQTGPLLISCKRKQFNFHKGTHYKKFSVIPLASKGWHSKKANGDYFSILPSRSIPAFILPEEFDFSPNKHHGWDPDEFKSLGINDQLIERLKKMGIEYPTVIQLAAIPVLLEGKSVLITAETGCGKTLAYTLPMLEHIMKWKPILKKEYNSPFGVIVVPTRELALQTAEVITKLTHGLDINCKLLLANHLKKFLLNLTPNDVENVDIVISTLGVICKLTYHKVYSLSNCIHLVIDEADTLLDDSFVEKLRILLSRCKFSSELTDMKIPNGAQLSFVSATIPRDVGKCIDEVFPSNSLEKITTKYLHKIQPHITQNFVRCSKSGKVQILLNLVRNSLAKKEPVLIFSNKTETCNWIAHFLVEQEIGCSRYNSGMNNEDRMQSLRKFLKGEVSVLACTDVASRGHDIPRVKHVINYEFPRYMADYVHRCGRTGRIGNDKGCKVTSLISSAKEVPLLMEIEKSVRKDEVLSGVDNNITRLIHNKYNL